MYGHGFALLFLSCVYGEEEDNDRRKKLEDVLTRAVVFSRNAQTKRGGWGYISAADGSDRSAFRSDRESLVGGVKADTKG